MCHSDDGDATTTYPITPTGKVETNILVLHDYLSQNQYPPGHTGPLMERRPVLCAECHASNALDAPGVPPVSSLSNAMHRHHAGLPDITPDTEGCYNCHPGPETQCLRDVMSQEMAMNCLDCHGDMQNVSENPNPWLKEPRCDSAACHGAGYALTQPLYRMSKGHANTLLCCLSRQSPCHCAQSRAKRRRQVRQPTGTRRDTAPMYGLPRHAANPPLPTQRPTAGHSGAYLRPACGA